MTKRKYHYEYMWVGLNMGNYWKKLGPYKTKDLARFFAPREPFMGQVKLGWGLKKVRVYDY